MATNTNLGYDLDEDLNNNLESDLVVPTDTSQESDIQEPSTEGETEPLELESGQGLSGIRGMEQVYADRVEAGQPAQRPGALGFAQDTIEGTARSAYEGLAPMVGLSDTLIDAINFASAGDTFDIPKLPA